MRMFRKEWAGDPTAFSLEMRFPSHSGDLRHKDRGTVIHMLKTSAQQRASGWRKMMDPLSQREFGNFCYITEHSFYNPVLFNSEVSLTATAKKSPTT